MNKEHISKGDYAVRKGKKQQKLKKRFQVVQHYAFQKSEGVHYQPQDFHTKSRNYKIVYNEYTFFHLQFYIL